jgi:hypothetical protein
MVTTAIAYLASFIHTYLHEIAFGITSITMVLFGPYINRNLQRLVRNFHWLLRYVIFVLLCTAGYAFLSQVVYRGIKQMLHTLSNPLLVVTTVLLYLMLAWVAKEQKKI